LRFCPKGWRVGNAFYRLPIYESSQFTPAISLGGRAYGNSPFWPIRSATLRREKRLERSDSAREKGEEEGKGRDEHPLSGSKEKWRSPQGTRIPTTPPFPRALNQIIGDRAPPGGHSSAVSAHPCASGGLALALAQAVGASQRVPFPDWRRVLKRVQHAGDPLRRRRRRRRLSPTFSLD